jgi:hypothetical protein
MSSTIKIKRGSADPTAAQVTNAGELAANTTTPKVFLKTADDSSTTPIWVGATIESSPADWTSASKLATQSAINTTFMPKVGGSFTGPITLNAQSGVRFADADSSNYVAFRAPATVPSNLTWTLPSGDGINGYMLSTDGSGVLGWSTPTAQTTILTANDNSNTTRYLVFSSSAQNGASLYVDDTTTPLSYNPSTAELTIAGDLNLNGGDLKTTSSAASLFDATATSITMGAAATGVTLGYSSTAASITNISTGAAGSGVTKTLNIGTGGAASSTTNINLGSTNGGTVTVNKDLVVSGDLTVNGTTTTINSTTIAVDDKNLVLGADNTLDTAADGGGITLKGASDKTLNWVDATDAWTSSEHFGLASGKAFYINASSVLNSSTLGTGVTISSLSQVGTIATGTWNGTAIGLTNGGTNASITAAHGAIVYSTASALGVTSTGISGYILKSNGNAAPSWVATSSVAAGTLATTTDNTDTTRYLAFSTTAGSSSTIYVDDTTTPLAYNPSNNKLTANALASNSASSLTLGGTNTQTTSLQLVGHSSVGTSGYAGLTAGYLNLVGPADSGANPFIRFSDVVIGNGYVTDLKFTASAVSSKIITLPDNSGTVLVYGNGGNTDQITKVGTIATGVWQGTSVALLYGGTNAALTAVNGGIVYSSSTAMAITAVGTSGYVLQSNGAGAPAWVSAAQSATNATTVTLVATDTTAAAHYITFVDSSTGNENIRTDTSLAYNPSTNVLTAGTVDAIIDGGSY